MVGIITIPFHIGDFLSSTLHMDTLEKGAYIMLLLAHYQSGEKGLPNDDKKLSRIAGVSPKVWMRIRNILSEKFIINDEFWVHSKCVEVLRKVYEKSSAQRAKVLKRYETDSTAVLPRYYQPKPKPKPKIFTNVNNVREEKNNFDDWYEIYPHKVGKVSAQKAYKIAIEIATQTELVDGVKKYIQLKPPDRKWCNPATWLNQQRWLDQPNEPREGKSHETLDDVASRVLKRHGIGRKEISNNAHGEAVLRDTGYLQQNEGRPRNIDGGND